MLRKAWDLAVYGYQYRQQSKDQKRLDQIDLYMFESNQGYETVTKPGEYFYFSGMHDVRRRLGPEEVQARLWAGGKQRERIEETMKNRREKYGLSF
jgi:hypothetical protein